jgi:hypothetical protein
MNREQLKELVMQHFNLVPAVSPKKQKFGSLEDTNSAFTLVFPGDEPEEGDKVKVVTSEGQEMDAPDGEHLMKNGLLIKTEDSVIKEISKEEDMMETTEDVEVEEGEAKGEQFGADPSISVVEGTKPDNDSTKINGDQAPVDAMEKVTLAVDEMGGKIDELEGKVNEMMKKYESMKDKFSAISVEPASGRTLPKAKAEDKNDDFYVSNNAAYMKMMAEKLKNKK